MRRLPIIVLVLMASSLACSQSSPSATQTPEISDGLPTADSLASGVVKGFGISPQGFPNDYSQMDGFLREAASFPNGGVMFNGAWREDIEAGSDAGEPPSSAIGIMQQAESYGFTPIIVFGWRSDASNLHLSVPANGTDDWTNTEAQALFEQMLVDFAESYQPPYLFLGNESDEYFTSNPEDYARWIDFYNRAYGVIKAVSPNSLVGPIFQYERMSGLGSQNNWTDAQWGALEAHDLSRVDIVGITLYPFFSVATPEELPNDYLVPLQERIGDIPVAITETGWPAEPLGAQEFPWESSPEAQVRYVEALGRVLQDVDARVVNWLFLYPLEYNPEMASAWEIFGSLALYDFGGNQRSVYDAWKSFSLAK